MQGDSEVSSVVLPSIRETSKSLNCVQCYCKLLNLLSFAHFIDPEEFGVDLIPRLLVLQGKFLSSQAFTSDEVLTGCSLRSLPVLPCVSFPRILLTLLELSSLKRVHF